MSDDRDQSEQYRLWPPNRRVVLGISLSGAVVAGLAACFAYVGGFLSPGRLSQARVIDTFQEINGIHPGFRRNHAKGVCISGKFDSNGNGARLSKAAVFGQGSVPVIGRVSVAVGKPFVPDNEMAVRSIALSFRPPHGEEWRTGMLNIPVFPVKDVESFYEQMLASQAVPATGKPDPARMNAFLAAHPESAKALQLIKAKPFSTGFGNASYNSINAFYLINAAGVSVPVRWSIVAVEPFVAQTPDQAAAKDKNYLFDELITRLEQKPLQWHLVVTIGQPGDPANNATIPWPEDRERVDVGTVTIDHIETEAPQNCRDVNFDPLVLPSGIEPSDDPLLSARSATYSVSFRRRSGEPKTASEVQVPVGRKGN